MKSKINKQKLVIFIGIAILGCFFNSCKTTNQNEFEKESDLQVFIIDENNNPIPDFIISYSGSPKGFKSAEVYTNDKGYCHFENVAGSRFYIWGHKDGFKKLEGISVNLKRPTDVFFCVSESKDLVFEKVEKLYKKGRYNEGLELLSTLSIDKDSILKDGVLFYEAVGLKKNGNLKESEKKLKELKKSKYEEIRKLAEKI